MDKLKWGGLCCAGCGNNNLQFAVAYSGADWDCKAGEGSGYGYRVMLTCDRCGRVYPICHARNEEDVSEIRQ